MARLQARENQESESTASEAAKLIRKTCLATHKPYTVAENIRIVMQGIGGEESVSATCRPRFCSPRQGPVTR